MHFADVPASIQFIFRDQALLLVNVIGLLCLGVTLGVEAHLASQVLQSHVLVALQLLAELGEG